MERAIPTLQVPPARVLACYAHAWRQLRRHFWPLLLVGGVEWLLQNTPPALVGVLLGLTVGDAAESLSVLLGLLYGVLAGISLRTGLAYAFLRVARGSRPGVSDVFAAFSRVYLATIACAFLTGLALMGAAFALVPGGLVLGLGLAIQQALVALLGLVLLLPGALGVAILAMRLSYGTVLTVAEGLGPLKAINESWQRTKGHTWTLVGLGLLGWGIAVAALAAAGLPALLVLAATAVAGLGGVAPVLGAVVFIPVFLVIGVPAFLWTTLAWQTFLAAASDGAGRAEPAAPPAEEPVPSALPETPAPVAAAAVTSGPIPRARDSGWFVLRRAVFLPLEVLLVTLVIFSLLRVIPGDAALLMVAGGEDALSDPEVAQALRVELGINGPLATQYAAWTAGVLTGDWGTSFWTEEPVLSEIAKRLPVTLELLVAAVVGAASLIVVGGAAAVGLARLEAQPGLGAWVAGGRLLWLSGWLAAALPAFGLSTWFIVFPAIWWGYLPPRGYVEPWVDPGANLRQFLLPSLALALALAALTVHDLHAGAVRALGGGLGWSRALVYLLLRATGLVLAQVGVLLSLVIVLETVFALPGTGTLLLRSMFQRDYPQIMGGAMLFALVVIGARFAADLLSRLADTWAGDATPATAPPRQPARWPWALAGFLGTTLLVWPLLAALAPAAAPYDPSEQHLDQALAAPGAAFPLGADNFGRDILSRLLYALGTALPVGGFAAVIVLACGVPWGVLAAYVAAQRTRLAGLLADLLLLPARATSALPLLVGAMAVLAAVGPGPLNVTLAVAFVLTPWTALLVRQGLESPGGMARRVGALLASAAGVAVLGMSAAILLAACLDFLGIGTPPPTPTLGGMLSGFNRTYMLAAPWMAVFPVLLLVPLLWHGLAAGQALLEAGRRAWSRS